MDLGLKPQLKQHHWLFVTIEERGIDPSLLSIAAVDATAAAALTALSPRRKSDKDGRKKTMRHSRWKSCGRQIIQGFILRAPLAPGL